MEEVREIVATIALMRVPGAGAVTVQRLRAFARSRGLNLAKLISLSPLGLTKLLPSGFEENARLLSSARRYVKIASALIRDVERNGGTALLAGEPGYPHALTALGDEAPPVLFCRGAASLLDRPLAGIVGTRTPTEAGLAAAKDAARHFVALGGGIVSGAADGVDTAAHRAALEAGGSTAAVLPLGLLAYRIPAYMHDAFRESRVLLVSQFLPHDPWTVHGAVTRNAVIASLARLVCVIEPRKTGGSIRTGRCAREQGKPVYCAGDPAFGDGEAALHAAGAEPLIDKGRLRTDAIDESWRNPPHVLPQETGLLF